MSLTKHWGGLHIGFPRLGLVLEDEPFRTFMQFCETQNFHAELNVMTVYTRIIHSIVRFYCGNSFANCIIFIGAGI